MVDLLKKRGYQTTWLFVILACMSSFLASQLAFANDNDLFEDFDNYPLGDIAGEGNLWSTAGTYSGDVTSDYFVTLENSLSFTTATNLGVNWVQWALPEIVGTTTQEWYMHLKWNTPQAGKSVCIAFLNSSVAIHTYVCVEQNGDIYINGNDTARDLYDDTFTKLGIYINNTTDKGKVKVGDGTWSSEKNLGAVDQETYYIRLYNTGTAAYIDNLTTDTYQGQIYGDVIIEELPDYEGNIQIGSETELQYNSTTFCYVGTDCYFNVNYGYDSIGASLQLLDFTSYDVIASTTLEDDYLLQGTFIISDPGIETTQYYCLAYDNGGGDRKLYCDIELVWTDTTVWCGSASVCGDISTTSEFMYGVSCGFRQGACWLFNPTAGSISFFAKNIQNFEKSFPFNIVFDTFDEIELSIEESSSTPQEFGLPMYDGTEWYTATGVDANTYDTLFGTSTTSLLKTYTSYVVWIFIAIGMIYVVWFYGIT